MFRLKVSIVFSLFIVLAVAAAYLSLDEQRADARRRIKSDVQNSARMQLERELRLGELELRTVAAELAEGRISAYLEVIDRFRDDLDRVEAEVYQAVPLREHPLGDPVGAAKREALVAERVEFVNGFVEALEGTHVRVLGHDAWREKDREAFLAEARQTLIHCAAYAATNCVFTFTYFPLQSALEELRRASHTETKLDLAIVTSRNGIGLADAFDATWSSDKGFGARYPITQLARTEGVQRDLVKLSTTPPRYLAAVAAPVRYGAQVVGTILVGSDFDMALARRQSSELGVDVTYLHGETIVQSTLPEEAAQELLASGLETERPEVTYVDGDRFVAASVPLLGNRQDNSFRVLLSVDFGRALAWFSTLQGIVVGFGLLILLIGLGLIQVVLRGYATQFERIYAGVHEVLRGDHDYRFPYDMHDTLASSMAQSLNLMVAELLGRPLPEEEGGQGWSEDLLIGEEPVSPDASVDEEVAAVAPASTPAGAERSEELLKEPAGVYYRRLFSEYREARRAVGEPVDKITYVKFVEKLVRNERVLRERLGCRSIRFEVAVRDGQVMLTPIPLCPRESS